MYFVFSLSLSDHFAVAHVTPSMPPLCHDNERIALLQFKDSLIINKSASSWDPSPYPKVASWNLEEEHSDCCLWDGIKCSEETGHVIRLDLSSSCLYGSINSTSSLFYLVHLRWLSLANNDFNQSQIPSTIINLSRLSRLNLSMSGFSGQVPAELLELSKLVSLDISYNYYLEIQRPGLGSLFDKLSNLKVAKLNYVNISSSIPHNLGNLSSLTYLSLAFFQMQGRFSINIFQLPNPLLYPYLTRITTISLQEPITPSICKLSKLVHLDIQNNYFSEELPTFIGCLGSLEMLDVSDCNFSGRVPSSFSNLTQLSYLDISNNSFLGQDSSSLSWIAKNSKLNELGLANMTLIGEIPSWLGNLTQLTALSMHSNQLTGQIPSEMFKLSKLVYLDISYNHGLELRGAGLRSLFDKLSNLEVLKLAYVNISSSIPHNLGNLSSLTYLSLAFCQMQEELPAFIGCLGSLEMLAISDCNFSGRVPSSFSNLTQLSYLDFSNNSFLGQDSSSLSWIAKNSKLNILGLANMALIGEIPSWLGNLTQLTMLSMHSNQLIGQIPSQIFKLSKLVYLDISYNHGLKLRGAGLRSLFEKLSNLEVLRLANVGIFSLIPHNLENLSSLIDFSLENCGMQGTIPSSICNLTKLAYLNLAYNNFSGELPTFIGLHNRYSLLSSQSTVYGYSLTLNNKGVKLKYGKISNMITSILLSNNKFTGEIPASIANLKGLQTLNLSYNDLQGHIPPSMGNLTALESLDLSYNKLSGEIPQQLAELTFLKVFSVSHNHLVGPEP
ncbi:hypothetical protein JRO89_XS02G0122900 [Xanthoceras sorbifolium]|uniref:non-specific serine/threonine protein kinase n=1 Tax=Xanthoceras sorbifolium TaxID=99658 RepID=A0ABQ8IFN1_9ROSI|nr:hypothetical protein JRO89_XS02G0122900 [Xanthoceras sorbifolium]